MTGAILIGGRSRRMEGRDKTALRRDGQSVIERSVALLALACDRVVLLARDEAQAVEFAAPDGVEMLADLMPDCGPLGGLASALRSSADDVFLLGCDLPYLDALLLNKLKALFETRKTVPAVPRSPQPEAAGEQWRIEPLCAIWPRTCLEPAQEAIARKQLSMTAFAITSGAVFLSLTPAEAKQLRNINTPDDLKECGMELDISGQRPPKT